MDCGEDSWDCSVLRLFCLTPLVRQEVVGVRSYRTRRAMDHEILPFATTLPGFIICLQYDNIPGMICQCFPIFTVYIFITWQLQRKDPMKNQHGVILWQSAGVEGAMFPSNGVLRCYRRENFAQIKVCLSIADFNEIPKNFARQKSSFLFIITYRLH